MRFFAAFFLFFVLLVPAWALETDEDGPVVWQESAVDLPQSGVDDRFRSFYVSPASTNEFFINTTSLRITPEGVVRYVVLIKTPSGVENISYEGIRCETKEFRFYASLRTDKVWALSRQPSWKKILGFGINRYQSVLMNEYFCKDGILALTVDEIRRNFTR